MTESLKKLSPEKIEVFRKTLDATAVGISPKLAEYILQLDTAAALYEKYRVISECARHLQEKYPELSIHTCKSRIYDSINYLNDECSVTAESWLLYYADMFMKMFEVNLVAHNFREARTCLQRSCEYRIKASANAIDPDRIKFKPQIVSPDIELERMGVKKSGLLSAYKKALNIISKQDATDKEKQRQIDEVIQELNIKDIDYEEIKD
jgi:hypothetical protein